MPLVVNGPSGQSQNNGPEVAYARAHYDTSNWTEQDWRANYGNYYNNISQVRPVEWGGYSGNEGMTHASGGAPGQAKAPTPVIAKPPTPAIAGVTLNMAGKPGTISDWRSLETANMPPANSGQLTQAQLAQSARWGQGVATNPSAAAQSATASRYTGMAAQAGKGPNQTNNPSVVGAMPPATTSTAQGQAAQTAVNPTTQQGLNDQRAGEQNPTVPTNPPQGMLPGSAPQGTTANPPMIAGAPAPGWVEVQPGLWSNIPRKGTTQDAQNTDVARLNALAAKYGVAPGTTAATQAGPATKPGIGPDANGNMPAPYNPAQAALADAARNTGAALFSGFSDVNTRPNVMSDRLVDELPWRTAGAFTSKDEFMAAIGYVKQTDLNGNIIWVRMDIGGPKGSGGGQSTKPQQSYSYGYGGGYGGYGRAAYSSGGGGGGGNGYGNGPGLIRWNIRA